MFYRSPFPGDQFAELERRQREMQLAGEYSPSIDGSGAFPALNAGGTPQSVEIYACAPDIDPATTSSSKRACRRTSCNCRWRSIL